MEFVETPESRFSFIKDFPYEPSFEVVDEHGLRMAYIDEGPRDAPIALLLHGEPSWSYLYRKMIPTLLERGMRVVAPDLIGFGRSSKPTKRSDYTYANHTRWTLNLIESLNLHDMILFGQDWGSLIGLRIAAEHESRFAGIVIGNGFLPDGKRAIGEGLSWKTGAAFLTWRTFSQWSPVLPIGRILNVGSQGKLTEDEIRAYNAPFPTRKHKAGAREFPAIVPLRSSDPEAQRNQRAWKNLEQWEKPFITTFSHSDPILGEFDKILQQRIPGAANQPHTRVKGGHFLQERSGPKLATIIANLNDRIHQTPS
jgi:haloalkane dehalogenase